MVLHELSYSGYSCVYLLRVIKQVKPYLNPQNMVATAFNFISLIPISIIKKLIFHFFCNTTFYILLLFTYTTIIINKIKHKRCFCLKNNPINSNFLEKIAFKSNRINF